jgi:beta-hydroxylase
MVNAALWLKLSGLGLYLGSALYVNRRGQVRQTTLRLFADHSAFTAPYNMLMYWFSSVPTTPFVPIDHFPELELLRSNWQVIREEALQLFKDGHIRAAAKFNDIGFNSFFRTGWKRFYLKWYGDFLPSATHLCPKTVQLVNRVPSVNAAMFALLPPGGRLNKHRDPFAGSLRYHLGLSTPNSSECRIFVDGQMYYWRDGEDVMFDETYIHSAENNTSQPRIILFCDVQRPLSNRFARLLNSTLGHRFIKAGATQNVAGEPVSLLNRLYSVAHYVRIGSKRMKAWNRHAYYGVKWGLLALVCYWVFF